VQLRNLKHHKGRKFFPELLWGGGGESDSGADQTAISTTTFTLSYVPKL